MGAPKVPEWAKKQTVYVDEALNLIFFRRKDGRMTKYDGHGMNAKGSITRRIDWSYRLDTARTDCVRVIGKSIEDSVLALHPGARKTHLRGCPCGAPPQFKDVSANEMDKITCDLCLVIINERISTAIKRIAASERERLEDHVRTVDVLNGIDRLAQDGKDKDAIPF